MDHKSDAERFDLIIGQLEAQNASHEIHEYLCGQNINIHPIEFSEYCLTGRKLKMN